MTPTCDLAEHHIKILYSQNASDALEAFCFYWHYIVKLK